MMTARVPAAAGQEGGGGGGSADLSNGGTTKKQRDRWTDAEHKLFLEALKQFGRDWRNIELHVGSKTAVQIRSHAQKFFAKVERAPHIVDFQLPPPRPKRRPGQSAADQNKSGTTRSESGTGPFQRNPSDGRRAPDDGARAANGPGGAGSSAQLPQGFAQWANGVDFSWMDSAPGSLNELMHSIAVAALTSAAVTAHAVVAAAGQEYIQRVQKLAEENERYRFLQLPLNSSRSTLSQPSPQSTAPNAGTTMTNPSGGTSTDFNTTSHHPKSATPEPSIQPPPPPPPPSFKSLPGIIGTLMSPDKLREQLGIGMNPDGTARQPSQEQSTQALQMLDTLLHSLPAANPPPTPQRRAHGAPQVKRPRSSNSNREDNSAGTAPSAKRRKPPSDSPKRASAAIPRTPSACLPVTGASRSNLEPQDPATRVKAAVHAQRPTMSAPCGRTGTPSWGEPQLDAAGMAGATSDSGPTDGPPNNDSRGSGKAGTGAAGDGSDGDRCEHVGSGGGSAQPSGGSGSGGSGSKSAKESGNIDQAKAAHAPFEAKPNTVSFLPYPFMHKQQPEGQQDWAEGRNQEQAVQAAALVQQYKQAYEYGQAGLAWAQQAGWINGNVQVDPSHSAAPAACDAATPAPTAQVASANPPCPAAEGPYPAATEHKRKNTMHSRAGYSNRHGHLKGAQTSEGTKEATLAAEAAHQKEDYNAQKRHGSLPHRDEPMDQQDTASSIQDTHSMRAERSCMPAQCATSLHEDEDANAKEEGAANKVEDEEEDEINSVIDGSDEGSNEPVCGASNDDCNARDPRLHGRGRAGSAKDSNSVRPQKKKQRSASAPAAALLDPGKREVTPGLASDGSCGSGNSEEQRPVDESKRAGTGAAARPAHRPNDGSGNASSKGSGGQPSSPEERQGDGAGGADCKADAGKAEGGGAGGQQVAEGTDVVASASLEASPSPSPSPSPEAGTPFGPQLPPKAEPGINLDTATPVCDGAEVVAAGDVPSELQVKVAAVEGEDV